MMCCIHRTLSVLLLSILPSSHAILIERNSIATSWFCFDIYSRSFGCSEDELITVNYSFGDMNCGDAYTLKQTERAPRMTVEVSDELALYTVLLVDTSNSPIHPILHFGSVNVPGSMLQAGVDLHEVDTFPNGGYRGPSPPIFLAILPLRYNYEWVVARQSGTVTAPDPDSTVEFDFQSVLQGSEVEASSYFSSGFCVLPRLF